jgi:predicted aspartyl protease
MMRIKIFLVLLASSIAAAPCGMSSASAQNSSPGDAAWVPTKDNSAGLLVVPVEVNGRAAMALVDTGFSEVVVSRRFVAALGLPVQPLGTAVSVGGLQAFGRSSGLQLTFDGTRFPSGDMEVSDLSQVEKVIGLPIDIVIGSPLLAHSALEVDLDHGRIRLSASGTNLDGAIAVPLEYNQSRRRFELQGMVTDVRLAPILLDTGSDAALSVTADAFTRLVDRTGGATTLQVAGGGGLEVESIATLPTFELGSVSFKSVPVQGEPPGAFLAKAGQAASIGMGILDRYDFVIDAPAGRMLLKPRSTPPPLPAKSTVGVQGDYQLDRITVTHVMANSPAEKAGLKPGEEICAVNNVKVVGGWSNSPMRDWGTRPAGHAYVLTLCSGVTIRLVSKSFY